MGPAAFVIAILGCTDSSTACSPVAMMPTRYESKASCAAATVDALSRNTDADFPMVIAECRAAPPAGISHADPASIPVGARRG